MKLDRTRARVRKNRIASRSHAMPTVAQLLAQAFPLVGQRPAGQLQGARTHRSLLTARRARACRHGHAMLGTLVADLAPTRPASPASAGAPPA